MSVLLICSCFEGVRYIIEYSGFVYVHYTEKQLVSKKSEDRQVFRLPVEVQPAKVLGKQGLFLLLFFSKNRKFPALCQMMLVKRNLRIIWTGQKEGNLFLFCLFG
ncbi:hypothetical protein AOY33_14475 [Enterococcus durans]|nr:hypothetical protein AOY33_14475 [Enterococcus durans]